MPERQFNPKSPTPIRGVLFDGPIHTHWQAIAQSKGFTIAARVEDRYHVELRCDVCQGITKTKLFTLRTAQPICAPCLAAKQTATARAAGLELLERDPTDRHYAFFRAGCGHVLSRQFALIEKVAAGETGVRCEICLREKHANVAEAQGWTLIGGDPSGRVDYRLYRHKNCGAEQPVSLGNMTTDRFDCGTCGEAWPAAPSNVYLMRFDLEDIGPCLKPGFSRKPKSRLKHQLQSGEEPNGELLRVVAMPSGQAAIIEEKAAHKHIKTKAPHTIVPRHLFEGQLRVRSEIYTMEAWDLIMSMLDDIERRYTN
jgi:hypothetical protein